MKSGMHLSEFRKINISHDNNLFTLLICEYIPMEYLDLKDTVFKQNFRKQPN